MGWACLAGARLAFRRFTDARHCADRADEVTLQLLSTTKVLYNGRPTGALEYAFRHGDSTCRVVFGKGRRPLFSDASMTHLVALVSPHAPARPLVLRHDLYPFAFSQAQREAILAAASRAVAAG